MLADRLQAMANALGQVVLERREAGQRLEHRQLLPDVVTNASK
jgi:hypothetical protein